MTLAKITRRATYGLISLGLVLSLSAPVSAMDMGTHSERKKYFSEAAKEFGVPEDVLMATSYNLSRWESHDGKPSADGGFGPMHLTTKLPTKSGRDGSTKERDSQKMYTLDQASKLLNVDREQFKKDVKQNIRGGAAVLADCARDEKGNLPKNKAEWAKAVAKFAGMSDQESAEEFADDVYATLREGKKHKTRDGEELDLQPDAQATPDKSTIKKLNLPSNGAAAKGPIKPECPAGLNCQFDPARYAQNNPNDPGDYGNYDKANRPKDMKITHIVIHDMEGSYQSSIDWFKNPASYTSAQYLIRSKDGAITQMVQNKDVAWHAGNWHMNMHSIGVEHEGFAAEGATWYTEAMYKSSARLVRYLAEKYDIPLDREHIVGHDQHHGVKPADTPNMHWDPGPYWDWEYYMNLVGGKSASVDHQNKSVTIAPRFKTNQPPVTECEGTVCTDLPKQGANFVYLRTEPRADAPYITDKGQHPDGAPGTTKISDTSAKATHGMSYAVAGRQGEWVGVWFGGMVGWLHNPVKAPTVVGSNQKTITPKSGKETIPVYGRPLPEASAYPSQIPVQPLQPLQYTIAKGQRYVVTDSSPKNDYFHAFTFGVTPPQDDVVVVGQEKYVKISFNHREAFVKLSDVQLW